MFEALSSKLEAIFKKLRGKGLLKEEDVEIALKEVRVALLEADVNFKVVKDFTTAIKDRAVGKEVLESITPGQQVVKIVHDELCSLLGESHSRIHLSPNPPTVIMMVGLHGSGKTTTTAKLGLLFKKEGRHPMLVAADTQRPAAIQQLITLGLGINIPVFSSDNIKDPTMICEEAIKRARLDGRDILILDTAGRLHIDETLMQELRKIKEKTSPKETIFVADAMTGQDAVNIAKGFNDGIGIDGIILTKMDGDARGGAALSIRTITGKPIKFIGIGEKIDMIEPFYPERIAGRILGMGDVVSLVEKAEKAFDEKEAQKLSERILRETFTFDDLREQLRKVRNIGPLENLLSMLPGMARLKGLKVDEKGFIKMEAIINSMTPKERKDPSLINGSRKRRIAMGSGTTPSDVNRLLKQYLEMKKMFKLFKQGKMPKFMGF